MQIAKGYNNQHTYINVLGSRGERLAQVRLKSNDDETLAYATMDELLSLKQEIDAALKHMLGLE